MDTSNMCLGTAHRALHADIRSQNSDTESARRLRCWVDDVIFHSAGRKTTRPDCTRGR